MNSKLYRSCLAVLAALLRTTTGFAQDNLGRN
jgi:hypothetical protein